MDYYKHLDHKQLWNMSELNKKVKIDSQFCEKLTKAYVPWI